jgi:cobalt-zinc-cadmium efflux system membrane fusion protein
MKKSILWSIVGLAIVAGGIAFAWKTRSGAGDNPDATVGGPSDESPTHVVLPLEKFTSAGIESVLVSRQTVRRMRTVPGRIDYNGVRRVELKSSVDVVVREVLVKPGDPVQPGTRLASFDSPEIGLVRAEVEKNRAEWRRANQAVEYHEEVYANLDELLQALRQGTSPQAIEKTFEGKLLGDHREKVVSTYSKYVLAEQLWIDTRPLVEKGSVSTQVAKQRETERQVTKQNYQSVSEQSRFDARQERERARANQEYARRLVDVSRKKLQTLLGSFGGVADTENDKAGDGADLSRFDLVAPFAGTVEQRLVAPAQRLSAGTLAFVIADTRSLWVTADIRERDWQALAVDEGKTLLTVRVPALDDREFEARVDFVGRAVDDETHAVPLIAVLDNSRHLFRPGMFAWVSLPAGVTENALVVPPAAIQTHDGKRFVFVEEGPRTYRRVDVTVGVRTPEWVTIESGLAVDQRVVTRGAFILKSELLLEREEE